MKFVTMRVTSDAHKAAKAIAKRDGVKLWKAVEVALLKAKSASWLAPDTGKE
jgi:hypothetical protein